MVVIPSARFAATWLQREDRTDTVRFSANPNYWDRERGPHLDEVVFRNDLMLDEAIECVCRTEGEVDIVAMVPPEMVGMVEDSEHAKLVAADAVYTVAGIFDYGSDELPLRDVRARQALNLCIDRNLIVSEVAFGHATPLAGLTPDPALLAGNPLSPYPHDPEEAARLWDEVRHETGTEFTRPIRVAALAENERVARAVAGDIGAAFGVGTEVIVYASGDELRLRRRLAEKKLPNEWDILVFGHGAQSSDGVALEVHRAFVGESGELRAGPVSDGFENLYAKLLSKTDPQEQVAATGEIDRFVYDEAMALFVISPKSLYAVNQHVDFIPYATTFELADTSVNPEHWSRR